MLLGAKYTKSLSKLQNDMEKLRGTCVQLRTRVKEMEAALSTKTEECAHIKHEFEINGCLQNSSSIFGNLLTKSRETSFHALRTDRANLSSKFVERYI